MNQTRQLERTDRSDAPSSISDAIAATTRDLGRLLQTELELARTELREEAAAAGRSAVVLVVGAVVVAMGVLVLLLAAAWGLAEAVPLWAALLIVGAVTVAVGALAALVGKQRLGRVEAAPQTIRTLEEDARWARQRMS